MCLLVFAWRVHPEFPLVFAGNRDEFHDRPAAAAHWWDEFLKVSNYLRQHCLQSAATGMRPGNVGICPSSPEAAMLTLARQRLRPLEKN